jgi:dienelactone hydrolase
MKKTIIIIHEVYGVTENLLALKDNLINNGFSVVLPSLYEDDYHGNDEQESYNRFFEKVGIEKGSKIIESIITQNIDSEIILIGFSVGATIAWLFSSDKRINSIIGIYGTRIRNYLNITTSVRSYLFFCREKLFDIIPMINELRKKEKVTVELVNGEHGFYNFSDEANKIIKNKLDEKILKIIKL